MSGVGIKIIVPPKKKIQKSSSIWCGEIIKSLWQSHKLCNNRLALDVQRRIGLPHITRVKKCNSFYNTENKFN